MLSLYKTNTNHITMMIQKPIQHTILLFTVNATCTLILLFKSQDFEKLPVYVLFYACLCSKRH